MEGEPLQKGVVYATLFVGGRPAYHIVQLHDSLADQVMLSNVLR